MPMEPVLFGTTCAKLARMMRISSSSLSERTTHFSDGTASVYRS
jgi:hypothetical protein